MSMRHRDLLRNIRFYVLVFSIVLSYVISVFVKTVYPEGYTQTVKMTQLYALTAITYLYLALLATPLTRLFTKLPFRGEYIKARRAIGVSAFYFGSLHAYNAFFRELGGFEGLSFLSLSYLVAISLSFTALVILFLMASTSFDFMLKKLTYKRFKFLHRFVYLAGILILIHALMLGTHFQDLSSLIPQVLWVALSFLFILEAIRIDRYLKQKYSFSPKIGLSLTLISLMLIGMVLYYLFPLHGTASLNLHAQHVSQETTKPVPPTSTR